MAEKKKTKKVRANKYEKPLKINGTFEEAIAVCMTSADKKVAEKKKNA